MTVKEFGAAHDERPQALLLHHGNGLFVLHHTALMGVDVVNSPPVNSPGFRQRDEPEDDTIGDAVVGAHLAGRLDLAAEVGTLGLRVMQVEHPSNEPLGIGRRDNPVPAFVFVVGNAVKVEMINAFEVDGGHFSIFGGLTAGRKYESGWPADTLLPRRPWPCRRCSNLETAVQVQWSP